jgi:ABC-type molybdate transport system ATPase subunit
MLARIRALSAYQQLLKTLRSGQAVPALDLMRPARLPLLAALHLDLNIPILLVTDRTDRALTILDELGFWLKQADVQYFP